LAGRRPEPDRNGSKRGSRNACDGVWSKIVLSGGDFRMIAITINGEPRRFRDPLNCKQLIDQLELAGKRVALERNGEIVPRSRFGDQQLADGDRLEIVVAVGGG
jgi:sulfur carrier protein